MGMVSVWRRSQRGDKPAKISQGLRWKLKEGWLSLAKREKGKKGKLWLWISTTMGMSLVSLSIGLGSDCVCLDFEDIFYLY